MLTQGFCFPRVPVTPLGALWVHVWELPPARLLLRRGGSFLWHGAAAARGRRGRRPFAAV